jgi:hypothetical protein
MLAHRSLAIKAHNPERQTHKQHSRYQVFDRALVIGSGIYLFTALSLLDGEPAVRTERFLAILVLRRPDWWRVVTGIET